MARPGFVDLGAPGLAYVREHLTGVNPFCTALAAVVDAAPGRALTLPAPGAQLDRLYRFTEGGLLAANPEDGSAGSWKTEQGAYLVSILRAAPDSVCIVDDFNPTWSEFEARGAPANAFGVDDQVYHLFTAEDDPAVLVQALRMSDVVWHGVAAICADAPEMDEDRVCSADALQYAAASAIALTCTAYDGEGFVIWRRG